MSEFTSVPVIALRSLTGDDGDDGDDVFRSTLSSWQFIIMVALTFCRDGVPPSANNQTTSGNQYYMYIIALTHGRRNAAPTHTPKIFSKKIDLLLSSDVYIVKTVRKACVHSLHSI